MAVENWQAKNSLTQCVRIMYENHLDDGDITFKVGTEGAEFKAHKFILRCRSSVLSAMIKDRECSQTEAPTINDLQPEIFRQFLEFLYTDKTNVTIDNLEDLLFCADKYKVDMLASLCRSSLKTFISTSLVCKVMAIAQRFSDSEIIEICLKKVDNEIPKFLFTEDFLRMCPSCIYKIIQRDSISAPEELIFDQVVKWSKEECGRQNLPDTAENQREVLGDMLKEIRFPIMEHPYLNDVICESGILNDKEKVDILRQQLQTKNASKCLFKKKERKKQPTKLMISNSSRKNISESVRSYSLDDNAGLTFSVNYAAIFVGVYLNFKKSKSMDNIENVVVKLTQEDDHNTQRFAVPLSECIADNFIKLYPRYIIHLSGKIRYTVSLGFTSGARSGMFGGVHISQIPMTTSYPLQPSMKFNGKLLSILTESCLPSRPQLICGFSMM